ncbi:MAG TPA: hypothetical protein VMD07_05040, partial [Candidatus Acidoferrales bacterium]|nr:hypothetical protein [Candidatus Acidoferrales bacterium]
MPLALALGAIASHSVFGALHKPDAVRLQPIAVVTAWGWSGVAAWAIYAVTMILAGAAYWLAVRRSRETPLAMILGASALACLAALAFRFSLSSDAYAYAAYGALSATHQNLYVNHTFPPMELIDARWTRTIGFEWPSLPACIYGPAFVAISRAIVIATHFDLLHTLVALRLLEVVAFVSAAGVAA